MKILTLLFILSWNLLTTATAQAHSSHWHGGYRGGYRGGAGLGVGLGVGLGLGLLANRGPYYGGYYGAYSGSYYRSYQPYYGATYVSSPYYYRDTSYYPTVQNSQPTVIYNSTSYVSAPPPVSYRSDEVRYYDAPQSGDDWLYCNDPDGFYPAISNCPSGWRRIHK
ncbi:MULTISPECIES: hypothetical protein [unclassified Undibacterium]|uniref:hypothetical protein n=1 Tax=unclassified Undibacterium TaxID=2630295 RepID=UPI002AC89F43|nr:MULTISPECIES: hypothetical protein [unclassified Undibacterium]MEB0139326.1 hypothetical protein [Undibacterium sp. CCC2.1]MEB0172170.1 hypothetical protein [Undibacterium sp. CCC1.1]MEB0176039.1 hypothetical protein [Undibacterium sp. CCC3.4]MEB0215351.1 hypothetical protein [Undibacterium sp. 5I2]WPX43426.1 hypothetical protein RHM61_18965 [Undibacterium sp. CCC3.4]